MGRNRFVVPETVRLELSDGDWIEVKERLTYGEQKRLTGSALKRMAGSATGEMQIDVDLELYEVTRLLTWLVDWSFCDFAGEQVPISPEAICVMDPDTGSEIEAALNAHIGQRTKQKNSMTPG